MARIHGQKGRLYVGIATSVAAAEPIAFLNSWTLNSTTDRVEVTAFEDNNKTYVSGKNDASGSFSGFWDDSTEQTYTAANDGDRRRMYLYPDATVGTAGPYWFGEAFFDFNVSGGVSEAVTINGTFNAASEIIKS